MWRKADFEGERIVIDALVRRRSAEKSLFLTPPDGVWVAAPSPILRPKVDYDAACGVPRQTPAAVTARLEGDKALIEREEGLPFEPAPVDEDAPSASEMAAAAVSARLEAILPDLPVAPVVASLPAGHDLGLPEPPAPVAPTLAEPAPAPAPVLYQEPAVEPVLQPVPDPVPDPDSAFRLTPEPQRPVASFSAATPFPAPFTPAAAEPSLFETVAPSRSSVFNLGGFSTSEDVALSAMDVPFVEPETPRFGNFSLLVSLGILGLAMFGGGVLWILTVASGPSMSQVKLFGYGASMIGAICFVVAAYLLLRRLAGPDEADDA
jgi:lysozyme